MIEQTIWRHPSVCLSFAANCWHSLGEMTNDVSAFQLDCQCVRQEEKSDSLVSNCLSAHRLEQTSRGNWNVIQRCVGRMENWKSFYLIFFFSFLQLYFFSSSNKSFIFDNKMLTFYRIHVHSFNPLSVGHNSY